MESIIEEELNKYNIKYYREVEFDSLINKETGYRYRFDFFIPDKNTIIEYDGLHHQELKRKILIL